MRLFRALSALTLLPTMWVALLPGPARAAAELPILSVAQGVIGIEGTPDPEDPYTPIRVAVLISEPQRFDVYVAYTTRDGDATAPEDYLSLDNARVRIPAGSRYGEAVVLIRRDTRCERDELFYGTISNPSYGRIGTRTGSVTIQDDDCR